MTRIAHTAALAVQLPAGPRDRRLRLKLCLHSQFPRLHRAWIERELKSALTRKVPEPNAGLRFFCHRHSLLERALWAGCDQLEIVVICSPVIETGNDLDFDWAIIDPSSMRTIVQAAGRVWRHRMYQGCATNVAVLGRSAIVMADKTGRLCNPGVETMPRLRHGVARIDLDEFSERLTCSISSGMQHLKRSTHERSSIKATFLCAIRRLDCAAKCWKSSKARPPWGVIFAIRLRASTDA